MTAPDSIEDKPLRFGGKGPLFDLVARVEDGLCAAAILLLAILPVLELILRACCHTGLPGNAAYVQNLTLWVGFVGAMVAARKKRHLSLSTGMIHFPDRIWRVLRAGRGAVSAGISAALCWASVQFVITEMESSILIGGWLPIWAAEAVLPLSFFMITVRFILQTGWWRAQLIAVAGVVVVALMGFFLEDYAGHLVWPVIVLLILSAAVLGVPIFAVLGGMALVLFFAEGIPVAAIPVETIRLSVSPAIPTIPLFTLTGYLLAEGGASKRLVRLFSALFGWLPGGLAIAATLVCAFFATFTGASGVTILALGGLLLPVLLKSGYPERFSTGLMAATGSIGILFPPSLAVILYGVVAHVPIPDLFRAGILPGMVLVGSICLFSVVIALRSGVSRPAFNSREAVGAVWEAKWEILLPVVALVGIFGGYTTLIEAAAITVVYALIVETVINRDLHPVRDVPRVVIKCATLVGGVFVILAAAMGLTNFLVDAEVPMRAADWVKSHIDSKIAFLLALNAFLLLVGCLMDIYSAIVVVVPLILPMAAMYGVHPLHLGMIFLVNLELGYLTPPVGMNLFLASYRFEKPLVSVWRATLPFLLVLVCVVLVITYVPALIVGVD